MGLASGDDTRLHAVWAAACGSSHIPGVLFIFAAESGFFLV